MHLPSPRIRLRLSFFPVCFAESTKPRARCGGSGSSGRDRRSGPFLFSAYFPPEPLGDRPGSRTAAGFLLSAGLHLSVVLLAAVLPHTPSMAVREQAPRRAETGRTRIIWYDLRRERIPIAPAARPRTKKASAPERAAQTIVAPAKLPRSDRLVWIPDAPVVKRTPQELPELLAVKLSAPPPPPAPKPARRFSAPPQPKRPLPQAPLDEPPEALIRPSILSAAAALSAPASAAPKLPPRRFAPPASRRAESQGLVDPLPEPDARIPVVEVTAAVIGPDLPRDVPPLAPEASEAARITAAPAPRPGMVSGGAVKGVSIPGLEVTVAPGAGAPIAAPAPPAGVSLIPSRFFYSPAFLEERRKARSVPLDSGRIPGYVAEMFTKRNCYMFTLDPPNPSNYSGGWLVWFAERTPLPGDRPVVQPPVPFSGTDPVSPRSRTPRRLRGRVRLRAVIRETGFVDEVGIVSGADDLIDRAARDAFRRWTFQPALRSGIRVAVDALVEIPFDLRPFGQEGQP